MMVMDLKQLRKRNIVQKIMNVAFEHHDKNLYFGQSALNVLVAGWWQQSDEKRNHLGSSPSPPQAYS
jgi:lipopolysaccharide biosynthesis glycosyltransferase